MPNRSIEFDSERQLHKLYGEIKNLLAIEKSTRVKIVARGISHLEGDPLKMDHCEEFFSLYDQQKIRGLCVHNKYDIFRFLDKVNQGKIEDIKDLLDHPLCLQIRKNLWCQEILANVNFWNLF